MQLALAGALDRGEQAILFLNRRGAAAFVMCRECGTEFSPVEAPRLSPAVFRRVLIIAGIILVATLAYAVVFMPGFLMLLLVLALFYLPIYLPFLLSFTIRAPEWRGMKWALRIGSLATFFVRAFAMATRTDHGDDVAGNLAGGFENLSWIWGVGVPCAFVAVITGLLMQRRSPAGQARAKE